MLCTRENLNKLLALMADFLRKYAFPKGAVHLENESVIDEKSRRGKKKSEGSMAIGTYRQPQERSGARSAVLIANGGCVERVPDFTDNLSFFLQTHMKSTPGQRHDTCDVSGGSFVLRGYTYEIDGVGFAVHTGDKRRPAVYFSAMKEKSLPRYFLYSVLDIDQDDVVEASRSALGEGLKIMGCGARMKKT